MMHPLFDRLEATARRLIATAMRFPVSTALALLCTIYVIHQNGQSQQNLSFALITFIGSWLGFSFALFAESRNISGLFKTAISALPLAPLYAILTYTNDLAITAWLLSFSALLSLGISPLFSRAHSHETLCQYNRHILTLFFFGILVSILFGVGLSSIAFSLEHLFSIKLSHHTHFYIWAIASLTVAPLYIFSHVHRGDSFVQKEESYSSGIRFIVLYILSPLILIYTAILYAYGIKAVFSEDVTTNQLIYIICGYALTGMITHFFAAPLVKREPSLILSTVTRYFYPAALFPALALLWLIGERVVDFGLTEQRYIVLAFALWLIGSISYMLYARHPSVSHLISTASLMLFLASFGPWGAIEMSTQSQKRILFETLERNELIAENGKVQKSKNAPDITFEDARTITSILQYFANHKRYDAITAAFPPINQLSRYQIDSYISSTLGIIPVGRYLSKNDYQAQIQRSQHGTVKDGESSLPSEASPLIHQPRKVSTTIHFEKIPANFSKHPKMIMGLSYDFTEIFGREQTVITHTRDLEVISIAPEAVILGTYEHGSHYLLAEEKIRVDLAPIIKKLSRFVGKERELKMRNLSSVDEAIYSSEKNGFRMILALSSITLSKMNDKVEIDKLDFHIAYATP